MQYSNYSLLTCLWLSLLCGLCVDLLAFQTTLGTYALIYCLTTLFLYRSRLHFFEQRLSTLPIMTFSFAFLCALIQLLLYYGMGKKMHLSGGGFGDLSGNLLWEWIMSDLVQMPLCDALYALLAFSGPTHLFSNWRAALYRRR